MTVNNFFLSFVRALFLGIKELKAKIILHKLNKQEYFVNKHPVYINQRQKGVDTYWSKRICAIASLQMAIETLTKRKIKTLDLVNGCLAFGGYDIVTDTGWYHSSLVEAAKGYGINAQKYRFFGLNSQAISIVNGDFVLSSLESPNGGHMILLYGVRIDDNHNVEGFWAHDPGDYKPLRKNIFLTSKEFLQRTKFQGITIHG